MLKRSVKLLKGVGSVKSAALSKLNVETIEDLIHHYPRRYEDYTHPKAIANVKDGEHAVFLARVKSIDKTYSRDYKNLTKVKCEDDTGTINILYMGVNNAARSLKKGELYWFHAPVQVQGSYISAFHAEFMLYSKYPEGFGIKSIYPLSNGINQADFHRWLKACEQLLGEVEDELPEDIEKKLELMSKPEALNKIHFPNSLEEASLASRRLMAEELYIKEMKLALIKAANSLRVKARKYNDISTDEIKALFHFELTASQIRAIKDIKKDMLSSKPMSRLLFGDVGSGKTAVALAASYIAVMSGYQSCLLAPTELLARQHFESFKAILGDKIDICLLIGAGKNKAELYQDIESGRVSIIISTHAVLQDNLKFKALGLIINDEEHRFGVLQKLKLQEKSADIPDTLSLSATPIPRTLTKAYYGDMDISFLEEQPKGRLKIITKYIKPEEKPDLLKFIAKHIAEGEQCYFILPRIEEDPNMTMHSVVKAHAWLEKTYSLVSVALLHGMMSSEEKSKVLEDFSEGKHAILVATSVVEVGIDVPNATIIVISDAERFGLSQLHQLRGRVGRGHKQSFCFLTSSNYNEDARKRIDALQRYSSGYDIAKIDLEIRGPGEILGIRQHGFVPSGVKTDEEMELINKIRAEVELKVASMEEEKIESLSV